MALIKSTFLAQISGSINGTTFAHNQGGAYARNRSAVSNPQTGRQDQVRTAMTSLSKMWGQSLTQNQRDEWIAYGGSVSVVNRVGDIITLSGIAAFNRLNLFRVGTLGAPVLFTPPGAPPPGTNATIPAYNSAEFANTSGVLEVELSLTAEATGYSFVIWYSASISPGIQFFRGPYAGYTTEVGTAVPNQQWSLNNPPAVEDEWRALKITMYETASSLPIWTINVDPMVVPAP